METCPLLVTMEMEGLFCVYSVESCTSLHAVVLVFLFKGGKSNEETRESPGSPIFHGCLASGDSAEMFFFIDIWVKSRVGVSKIGVCVLLCFCEAGVFVLLFGANASNQLVVCIGIVGACV